MKKVYLIGSNMKNDTSTETNVTTTLSQLKKCSFKSKSKLQYSDCVCPDFISYKIRVPMFTKQ